jgi:PST family polysaccharide transporter
VPENQPAALARIVVRSTVWVTLGSYANQLIGFAAMLALTRILAPDVFGYLSLAAFWVTLFNLRSKAGLNYAALREPAADGRLLGTYFALDAAAAGLSLGLTVAAALIFAATGLYRPEVVIMMLALCLADSLTLAASPFSLALEKELQLSRLTLVTLVSYTLAYALAIGLALSGAGVWSLLVINLVTYALSAAGVYWVCRRRLPGTFRLRWQFDRALARRLLRAGLATGLSLAVILFVTQYDNWLIGTFISPTTLGYYDRAYRIASWPNLLLTLVVSRVGYLTMTKVKDDLPRLTHTVRLSLWILLALGAPMTLALVFGAPDIVDVLYTARYADSAPFLRFLAVSNFAWVFVNAAFWMAVALDHRRVSAGIAAAQAATLIAVGTPLTLAAGAGGTLAGVGAAMAVGVALSLAYVFRRLPLSLREVFGAPLAAAAAAVAVLLVLSSTLAGLAAPPIIRAAVVAAAGAAVYWGILFAARPAETSARLKYLYQAWRARK